jgi:tetratricopeptide (TPR) repeat protein
MNFFRRKPLIEEKTKPDPKSIEASTMEEYFNRGMLFYSHEDFDLAEADFKQAMSKDPEAVDPIYGLALTYKGANQAEKAIEAFKKVVDLLQKGKLDNQPERKAMLMRISRSHIKSLQEAETTTQAGE